MNERRNYRPTRSARPQGSMRPNSAGGARGSFLPTGATIYVGNLPYDVTEKDLINLFSKFGRVRSAKLVTKPGTQVSKGIAFVKMLKKADAAKAIKNFDGRVIGGRTIKCSEAIENSNNQKAVSVKKSSVKAFKADKEELAMVKRERRKPSLQKMFENIGKR